MELGLGLWVQSPTVPSERANFDGAYTPRTVHRQLVVSRARIVVSCYFIVIYYYLIVAVTYRMIFTVATRARAGNKGSSIVVRQHRDRQTTERERERH